MPEIAAQAAKLENRTKDTGLFSWWEENQATMETARVNKSLAAAKLTLNETAALIPPLEAAAAEEKAALKEAAKEQEAAAASRRAAFYSDPSSPSREALGRAAGAHAALQKSLDDLKGLPTPAI